MPLYFLICFVLGGGSFARADLAKDLSAFFLNKTVKYRRPNWGAELETLTPTEARSLLIELRKNSRLMRRASAGNLMFSAVWDHIGKHYEGRGAVEQFSAVTRQFIDRAAGQGGKPDLYIAEMNAARSLGVDRIDYFEKAQNRDVRPIFLKRVQEELMRQESLRTGDIPANVVRLWRAKAVHEFRNTTFELRTRMMRSFRDDFVVQDRQTGLIHPLDPRAYLEMNALIDAPDEPDPNSTDSDLRFVDARDVEHNVLWRHSQQLFRISDRRPGLFGRGSVQTALRTGEYEMLKGLIRELDQILVWCDAVPDVVAPDDLRVSLAAMVSRVLAGRENLKDWAQAYANVEGLESQFLELLGLLLELTWSPVVDDHEYWAKHDQASQGRPVFSFKGDQVSGDPVAHVDPVTPPSIEEYELTPLYAIDGLPDKSLPKLFRRQTPNDHPRDAWDLEPAGTTPGSVRIRALEDQAFKRDWLSVPTPIHQILSTLNVEHQGRALRPGIDFEVWRSRASRAYAIKRLNAAVGYVRVRASFASDAARARTLAPPRLKDGEWHVVARDLVAMGERPLAAALVASPTFDSARAKRLVRDHTRYSFHPESGEPAVTGPFGPLKPFLDEDGQLCIQCAHAATFLLLPLLRRAYEKHPEFSFQSNTFLLRSGEWLTLPEHDAVEVFWRGHLHAHLDPSPRRPDERAPVAGSRRKPEGEDILERHQDELRTLLTEVHERARIIWPTGLGADSPYATIRALAERTLEPRWVAMDEVDVETEWLERWIEVSPGNHRAMRSISRFHRTMEQDLRRMLGLIERIVTASCDDVLSRF